MGRTRAHGRVLIALIVAAAPLVAAGVAGGHLGRSAQALPSADYGGGALGSGYSKRTFKATVITLRMAADGRSGRTYAYVRVPCNVPSYGLRGDSNSESRNRFSVDAAGRFTARDTRRYQVSKRVRATEQVTLKGHVTGDRASGTVLVQKTFRKRGRRGSVRCTSGDRPWEARAPAELADVPAPPKAGATYYGPARQGAPLGPASVSLRVSADGARVEFATQLIDMGCSLRKFDPSLFPPMAIRPDGSFAATRSVTDSSGGTRVSFTVKLAGHFVVGGVRGTIGEELSARERGRTTRCARTNLQFVAIP